MPRYDIKVELIGHDGNAFNLIGRVAKALRKEVSAEAATEFTNQAMEQGSYDELLAFIQETVDVT